MNDRPRTVRLCHVATAPVTLLKLVGPQLTWFARRGFDVTAVASPGPELDEVARRYDVRTVGVPMTRAISPLADLRSLLRLVRVLDRRRFDIVHVTTPKAGLLGALAAKLTGQPIIFNTLRGLRFETACGARRTLLRAMETLVGRLSHRVVCISHSLRRQAIREGVVSAGKSVVLGAGSSNGLDAERFVRDWPDAQRRAARSRLGLPPDACVVGFAGRLSRDKGVEDLLDAMRRVRQSRPGARLLIVGDWDEADPVPGAVRAEMARADWIAITGFVAEPEAYYGAMDLLAFPSYREGFGNVAVEAAAAGVPTVGYRTTGVVDSVLDGVTGVLVRLKDRASLADAMVALLNDPPRRRQLGDAGRRRAVEQFDPQRIWSALEAEYRRLLLRRARPGQGG